MRAPVVLLAFGVLACSHATSAPASRQPAPARQDTARAGGGARPGGQQAEGPKPYNQVITARTALARPTDRTARSHFVDLQARIDRILNPR